MRREAEGLLTDLRLNGLPVRKLVPVAKFQIGRNYMLYPRQAVPNRHGE
jgi:hypothetical protein